MFITYQFRHLAGYDYVIVNEALEPAVAGLMAIIAAERRRVLRIATSDLERIVQSFDGLE